MNIETPRENFNGDEDEVKKVEETEQERAIRIAEAKSASARHVEMKAEAPIPSHEEVNEIMLKVIDGRDSVEKANVTDELGVVLWEVSIQGKDETERIEYSYIRKGPHSEGDPIYTTVSVVFYENDKVVYATSVAKYLEGKWVWS